MGRIPKKDAEKRQKVQKNINLMLSDGYDRVKLTGAGSNGSTHVCMGEINGEHLYWLEHGDKAIGSVYRWIDNKIHKCSTRGRYVNAKRLLNGEPCKVAVDARYNNFGLILNPLPTTRLQSIMSKVQDGLSVK